MVAHENRALDGTVSQGPDPEEELTLWSWYQQSARPVLELRYPSQLEQLDEAWEAVGQARRELLRGLEVGFLGNAGVGKSTLVNALAADQFTLLPQGGVGPLTAQATLVRWSAEPYFRVTYHGRERLLQLLWALERTRDGPGRSPAVSLPPPVERSVESMIAEDSTRGEFPGGWLRQASQLVLGRQFSDGAEPYLLDGLRAAVGLPSRWGSRLLPAEEQRLTRIRAVIEFAARGAVGERWGSYGDLGEVMEELRLHAAGYLSPLVRTLEVGWEGEHLAPGLVLVDLPGLGVANDESRRVTERWTERLHVLVLVVDRSGLSEACATWLRGSRFMRRVPSTAHGASGPSLIVVPVKLDLSADDARRTERQLGGGSVRSWREHYQAAGEAARALLSGQLRDEWVRGGGGAEDWDRTAAQMLIQPACTREYLLLRRADPEDPARIREPAETGLPALRAALARLAHDHKQRLQGALAEAESRLQAAILALLEHPEAERATAHRWELLRLRDELAALDHANTRRTG